MIDLEHALTDLAEHLDHPAADGLSDAIRRRLDTPRRSLRRDERRPRALLVAAAVLVVVAAAVVAVAPARHAVADWLGIGAVEVRRSNPLPIASSTTKPTIPGPNGGPGGDSVDARLARARRAVRFPIAAPPATIAGRLADVDVDPRVPGGLVVLTYGRFTLVEIATDTRQPPPLGKLIGPQTRADDVVVNGERGLWIGSAHEIGFLDRSGNFESDTVRRSGPVLLWAHAGVTYRVEGLATLAEARAIAAAIA